MASSSAVIIASVEAKGMGNLKHIAACGVGETVTFHLIT